MTTCEDLFLLLTNDKGSVEGWGTRRGFGLVAAAVADLVLAERITLDDAKDPRVHVLSTEPTGDPALDHVLDGLTGKEGKKLSSIVQTRRLDPGEQIGAALAARGVVRVEPKRLAGLVPAKYPTLDPGPEQVVRSRLRTALAPGGRAVLPGDGTILAIVQGLDATRAVLGEDALGLSKRELKARIGEIAAQSAEGTAVAKAVQAVNTAIVVAAIIPVVTSAGS